MHKLLVSGVTVAALLAAGSLAPAPAAAIPVDPAVVQIGAEVANPTPVHYRCPAVWRCHPWGCSWRRVCYWYGNASYYWPQAYYYGPYRGRPWWRYHHRYWR